MKTKTDIYTKIVLTVIAVFLGIIVFKDVTFVTKAQANELDLSALKIENVSDAEGTTFFIYENSKLKKPFSLGGSRLFKIQCEIGEEDVPTHVITNRKVPNHSSVVIKRTE